MAKLKTTLITAQEDEATLSSSVASIASDDNIDPPVASIENNDIDADTGEELDPDQVPDIELNLALSIKTKNVSEEAGSFNVNITSNSDWVSSNVPSWITLTPDQGNGDKTVKVAYSANTAYSQRNKAITFSVGDLTQTLTVTQDATPEPIPDPEPQGEEPDYFADQILQCFPGEQLMYIDRQGGLYVYDTKEHIRKKAVLYKNPYYNKL